MKTICKKCKYFNSKCLDYYRCYIGNCPALVRLDKENEGRNHLHIIELLVDSIEVSMNLYGYKITKAFEIQMKLIKDEIQLMRDLEVMK